MHFSVVQVEFFMYVRLKTTLETLKEFIVWNCYVAFFFILILIIKRIQVKVAVF